MTYHKIVSICYVLFVTLVAMFSRDKLNISSKSGPNKSPQIFNAYFFLLKLITFCVIIPLCMWFQFEYFHSFLV